jgi:predicted RNase H-like HicB family nuclease
MAKTQGFEYLETEGGSHTKVEFKTNNGASPQRDQRDDRQSDPEAHERGMTMQVTAIATRSSGWWAIEVPELPGLFTQTRRLDQVSYAVADAARLLTDDAVDVVVKPALPDDLQRTLKQVRVEASEAEVAQRRAAEHIRALVARLRTQGWSVRDVGTILGVSPQRVSQLAAEKITA